MRATLHLHLLLYLAPISLQISIDGTGSLQRSRTIRQERHSADKGGKARLARHMRREQQPSRGIGAIEDCTLGLPPQVHNPLGLAPVADREEALGEKRWCHDLNHTNADTCESSYTYTDCAETLGAPTVYQPCHWNPDGHDGDATRKCYAGQFFTCQAGVDSKADPCLYEAQGSLLAKKEESNGRMASNRAKIRDNGAQSPGSPQMEPPNDCSLGATEDPGVTVIWVLASEQPQKQGDGRWCHQLSFTSQSICEESYSYSNCTDPTAAAQYQRCVWSETGQPAMNGEEANPWKKCYNNPDDSFFCNTGIGGRADPCLDADEDAKDEDH